MLAQSLSKEVRTWLRFDGGPHHSASFKEHTNVRSTSAFNDFNRIFIHHNFVSKLTNYLSSKSVYSVIITKKQHNMIWCTLSLKAFLKIKEAWPIILYFGLRKFLIGFKSVLCHTEE